MATRSPFGTLANLSIMATSFIAVAISYTLRYIELESEDIEVSTSDQLLLTPLDILSL